jgi:nicotinamide riboside transporter PnuC
MSILTWIFTGIALYGTWLNAKGQRQGFYWWIITDIAFSVINFQIEQYALSLLFLVYTVLAIKGLITWKKIQKIHPLTIC